MATITASAAGGEWKATTAWEEAKVPGKEDDVVLGAGSGSITIAGAIAECRSLEASAYAKTLTINETLKVGFSTSNGGLCLHFGASMTLAGTAKIEFVASSGTVEKITTGGKTIPRVEFESTTGKWELLDKFTCSGKFEVFEAAEFKTNSQEMVLEGECLWRKVIVTLGSSKIKLKGKSGIVWGIISGVTLNANTSVLEASGTGVEAKTFNGGTLTYNEVILATQNLELTGSNTIAKLQVNTAAASTSIKATLVLESTTMTVTEGTLPQPGEELSGTDIPVGTTCEIILSEISKTIQMSAKSIGTVSSAEAVTVFPAGLVISQASTQTITESFSTNGKSGALARIATNINGKKSTLSKTSGTVGANFMRLRDSFAEGGANWYAGTGSTNVTDNSGWKFEAAKFKEALSATLTFKGALGKVKIKKALSAKLEFKGFLKKVVYQTTEVRAKLEFKGNLPKEFSIAKKLTAALSFAGVLPKVFSLIKLLSAKLSFLIRGSGQENLIFNPSFAYDANGGTAAGWLNSSSWLINEGATNKVFVIPGYASASSIFGLESYLMINTAGTTTQEGTHTGEVIPVTKGVPITVYFSLYEEKSEQKVRAKLGSEKCGTAEENITQGTSGWKRHSVTLTPTASGYVAFSVGTGVTAKVAILIAAVSTSEPYFDGDSLGGEWTSTAGNSVSQLLYKESNPVVNPSFEYDTVGVQPAAWIQGATAGVTEEAKAASEFWASSGKKSFHLKGQYPAKSETMHIDTRINTGISNLIRVKPGQKWTAQMALNIITEANLGFAFLFNWYKVDGVTNIEQDVSAFQFAGETGVKEFEATSNTAPKEARYLSVGILSESNVSASSYEFYIDAVIAQEGAKVTSYHDGDSPNWYWTETPGNSISAQILYNIQRNTFKGLSAKLPFTGALTKVFAIAKLLTAKIEFQSTLERITNKALAATLTFVGAIQRDIVYALKASLEFLGKLNQKKEEAKEKVEKLIASLSFSGMSPRNSFYAFMANLNFLGALPRNTTHILSATLTFLGGLSKGFTYVLVATLNLVGSLPRNTSRALTAKLTFVGSLPRNIAHVLTAQLPFTGTLTKIFALIKLLTGTLPFLGSLNRNTTHTLTAKLPFTGTLPRAVVNVFVARLAFVGTLPRNIQHLLQALLGLSTRLLDYVIFPLRATLTFAGSLRRTVEKFTATLPFIGTTTHNITHALTATLTFLGGLSKSFIHTLTATLTFVGSLPRSTVKGLTATLTFAGTLPRNTTHALTALLSFTGTPQRYITFAQKATLRFAGAVRNSITRSLFATLTFAGSLPRQITRGISATLNSSGTLGRKISHSLTGTLTFAGSLRLAIIKKISAELLFFYQTVNLDTNPSFEYGITSWIGTETNKVEQTTEQSFSGTHSLKGTATAGGSLGVYKNSPGTLGKPKTYWDGPVTEGAEYTFSLYIRAATTAREAKALLFWYNAKKEIVGSSVNGAYSKNSPTEWKRYFVTATAPATAVAVLVRATVEGNSVGEVHYFDALQLTQTSGVETYVDGDTHGYEWYGTPGASVSVKTYHLQRNITHGLSAALSFLGTLVPQTIKNFAASLNFAGALKRNVTFVLSGAMSFVGSIVSRTVTRALNAALTFFGSIVPRLEGFIYRIEATLSLMGALPRNITAAQQAVLSFSTTLRDHTIYPLRAGLSFLGALRKEFQLTKYLTATLNLSGSLTRSLRRSLTASMSLAGSVGRSIVYRLEGALEAAGALQRTILHQLVGALGVSSKISIKIYYLLVASVTFTGTIRQSVSHQFHAALQFMSNVVPNVFFVQVFVASLGFGGQIARRIIVSVLQGALDFAGSIAEISKKTPQPIIDAIILKQESAPSITLRHTETEEAYGLINHLEGYPEMEFIPIIAKRRIFGRKG
jgi:hypothetical protein